MIHEPTQREGEADAEGAPVGVEDVSLVTEGQVIRPVE